VAIVPSALKPMEAPMDAITDRLERLEQANTLLTQRLDRAERTNPWLFVAPDPPP
jgi:hypothetical protein